MTLMTQTFLHVRLITQIKNEYTDFFLISEVFYFDIFTGSSTVTADHASKVS